LYRLVSFNKDSKKVKDFNKFEFEIYKGDEAWVPQLIGDTIKMLHGKGNPLFENGEQIFFMVYDDKKVVGRVLVGIDKELNRVRGFSQGYFSMFECIDDFEVCKMMMDAGNDWLVAKGMDKVIGPLSPSNGDDRKGFVIMGQGSPVLLNAYTKDYYPALIEKYGFNKNDDHLAYYFDPKVFTLARHEKVVEYTKKKFGFRVDKFNPKKVKEEAIDVKQILDASFPEEWDYLIAPSLEGVIEEFKSLRPLYDGHYCYIVRKDDKPIGFMVGLPDYNQVLKRMGGKLLPIGWAKFLIYKRKINGIRVLIQMVDKEYQKMGVNHAMFLEGYKDTVQTGIDFAEISCIDEDNIDSRNGVENFGAVHYRTYRTYKYDLKKA